MTKRNRTNTTSYRMHLIQSCLMSAVVWLIPMTDIFLADVKKTEISVCLSVSIKFYIKKSFSRFPVLVSLKGDRVHTYYQVSCTLSTHALCTTQICKGDRIGQSKHHIHIHLALLVPPGMLLIPLMYFPPDCWILLSVYAGLRW